MKRIIALILIAATTMLCTVSCETVGKGISYEDQG